MSISQEHLEGLFGGGEKPSHRNPHGEKIWSQSEKLL